MKNNKNNKNVFKYKPYKKRKNNIILKKSFGIIAFIVFLFAVTVAGYFCAEPIGNFFYNLIVD